MRLTSLLHLAFVFGEDGYDPPAVEEGFFDVGDIACLAEFGDDAIEDAAEFVAFTVEAEADVGEFGGGVVADGTGFVDYLVDGLYDSFFIAGVFDDFGQGRVGRAPVGIKPPEDGVRAFGEPPDLQELFAAEGRAEDAEQL